MLYNQRCFSLSSALPVELTGVVLTSALCASLVLLTGCSEEPPQPETVIRPIKIVTVSGEAGAVRREFAGTVAAAKSAEIAFEVAGKIVSFPVKEGEEVKQGAELAVLDASDYKARMAAAAADLRKAEADAARGTKLHNTDPGAIAQSTIDAYRRGVDVARAAYDEAKKALDDTVLRAPFSGRVARTLVDDFKNVKPGETILILQDDSSLEVVVAVPERDVASRRPGRTNQETTDRIHPEVIISSIPGRVFPARVKEFASEADPITRTFAATLAFDHPADVRVLPGMTAKVVVHLPPPGATRESLVIPSKATFADNSGAAFVWVVDPKTMTVERQPVRLGELSGESVQILDGLKGGEWIATSGVHHLIDGMQISRQGE